MTQPNSDTAAQFAAFQQWQAQQAASAAQSAPTPDETPSLSIADVLKALVRSARLPDEATVHAYNDVIDEAFPAPSTSDSEAAEA